MNESPVIQLDAMTENEFEAFMALSMRDHIEGQLKAGFWKTDEAERNMAALRSQLLPQDLRTPGHFFFSIKDQKTGRQVGWLWYMALAQEEEKQYFVIDIQIQAAYRRQGYGSQAFLAMENKARESGVGKIVLQVFDHNTTARAMYDKLGYVARGDRMEKSLTGESE